MTKIVEMDVPSGVELDQGMGYLHYRLSYVGFVYDATNTPGFYIEFETDDGGENTGTVSVQADTLPELRTRISDNIKRKDGQENVPMPYWDDERADFADMVVNKAFL